MLYSNNMKPVALPPGRARLSTKPAPTGSTVPTNTIGTVWVACNNAPTADGPEVRITSGASVANSAACLLISASLGVVQRASIRTFRPMVQPKSASACRNAPKRARNSASSVKSTPIRRMRSGCCARATREGSREKRPRRRAAKSCDELPPVHSITSSAVANSVSGTARPSALAVLRLITNSNLVGCSTGRSAGLAPLRIRST